MGIVAREVEDGPQFARFRGVIVDLCPEKTGELGDVIPLSAVDHPFSDSLLGACRT